MIEPILSDEAFLADVAAARAERDALHVWWLGQSGFLVQHNDLAVLFDPYLSDSLTQKYAQTDTPHVRMTRRVVAPEMLRGIDYVTSTHAHTDHLDGQTLNPLLVVNPNACFVYPRATQATVDERVTVRSRKRVGLSPPEWSEGVLGAIPAAHDKLEMDEAGNHRYVGYVCKLGPFTLYHSGDGVRYEGMARQLRTYEIDLAILPINGKLGNMDGRDAAQLAKEIEAQLVVPCHYEMFEFNTADPQALFVPECDRIGQAYRLLRAGERMTLRK